MNSQYITNNILKPFVDNFQFRSCIPPYKKSTKCNYHCPVCRSKYLHPNIAGRFHLITPTLCQCNGCNTIFEKSEFYAKPVNPRNLDGRWICSRTNYDDIYETGTQPESVM